MEKVKAFLVKHKWWVIALAVVLVVWLFMRPSNSGGGGGDLSMQYGGFYTDPNAMALAQQSNGQQFQMDMLNAQMGNQLQMATLESENMRYKIESEKTLGLAGIDMQKFLGSLESSTSISLANIGADSNRYTADIQYKAEQLRSDTANRGIEANKYIAGRQADVAKYQAKTQRNSSYLNFAGGLINKFF